jgi:hypothetical protein
MLDAGCWILDGGSLIPDAGLKMIDGQNAYYEQIEKD